MKQDEQLPFVVLILLTCNQKDLTLQCLKSLFECDYAEKKILLVDNGSSDGTVASVEGAFPQVVCLRNEENLGAAGGRNTGIEHAIDNCPFEYIVFLDNDVVVTLGFLNKLVDGICETSDKGVEIASPKIYLLGKEKVFDNAGGARVNFLTGSTQTRGHGEKDVGQYDREKFPAGCVPTTVILMRRQALLRAGYYDVAFDPYGYEDLDMVLRANLPTNPFLFVPDSVVYHKGSKTGFSGYSAEYAKVKAANLKLFLKRHSSPLQRFVFYCLLPCLAVKPISREIRKGNFRSVIALIKGFLGKGGK